MPKFDGGLGVKNLEWFNGSASAWRTNQAFREVCFRPDITLTKGYLNHQINLVARLNGFSNNVLRKIGNGATTFFGSNKWLGIKLLRIS